jgi:hypothetical protein
MLSENMVTIMKVWMIQSTELTGSVHFTLSMNIS